MSNIKKNYILSDEIEEGNSLIKESSELDVQSLYQILIKNPYLVNAIDDKKETILSYSLKNNNIEISNLILTSPIIDLDYQDREGNTYLHLAVNSKNEEIIKILIEKGIFINKQNKCGNTALHLAYNINDNSIIKLLIDKGIDKNILNKENKLAEEIKLKNKKTNANININNTNNKKFLNGNKYNIKNDYKTFIEKNINGAKKKNSTAINNNGNRKDNNHQNGNGNNNRSIASSKSGLKMKVKTTNTQDKKNNKINNKSNNNNNGNYNDKGNKAFNEAIDIDENYKNGHNDNFNENNKKYSEFEKTVKIDWDITKNHIIKNKENDEAKYLNYNYKEKKSNYGRDQDLCNFEDNNSFYNQKNENMSKKNVNKIKVNKQLYNNTNNKISPKLKKSDKLKNVKNFNNKTSNKIGNNNLENSIGYNPCLSGEYTMRSEKKRSLNHLNNLFGSKIDLSRSENDQVNQYNNNESKSNIIQNYDNYNNLNDIGNINDKNSINSFHGFSGNLNKNQKNRKNDMNINTINNNPKRKTATSKTINRNFLISNKIENKEENNLNKISSNMESSLVTESKLKLSHKKNNPLIEFLSQINLLKYLDNLDNNGFDDINLLIEEAKNGDIVKDKELKEAGINIPGDRAKILIRIKEKANLLGFTVPKSVYYTLKNNDDLKNDKHIIDLNDWLKNIKVDRYLMNFINNGYHSIELLLMQMETENPLTTEILRDEIGIDKIGYRSRILNKLKEEGRSLNNKLKTSVLVVNNIGDDKNCECIIF